MGFTRKTTSTTDLKYAKFSSGIGGTRPEVMNFSGACHMRFPSLMQAEKYSSVCRELIERELSRGFRPLSINALLSDLSESRAGLLLKEVWSVCLVM